MRSDAIDPELVRRLIAAQFPQWTRLPVRKLEPGGWDNRSFRLGEDMLVRLPSSAGYSAQVEKEQHWLPVLAAGLPLAIPAPMAMGEPGEGYPWRWSIYGWIEGETLDRERLGDPLRLARSLAAFLRALQRIGAAGAPPPGTHNFYRGGDLRHYDAEARRAIAALGASIDGAEAVRPWEAALGSRWRGAPVWVHGDMSTGNLLLRDGELAAVIDFGSCTAGDPACDLMLAWSFFTPHERAVFRSELGLDSDTWARGRGWALWKAAITLAGDAQREDARFTLAQLLRDPDSP